jgi:hypothetical protein
MWLWRTELGYTCLGALLSLLGAAPGVPAEQATICVVKGTTSAGVVIVAAPPFHGASKTSTLTAITSNEAWTKNEVAVEIVGSARLDATAALLREVPGAESWWAAGDVCWPGCEALVWESSASWESALHEPAGWTVSERRIVGLRLTSSSKTEDSAPEIRHDLRTVRGFEWKGARYLVGATRLPVEGWPQPSVWLAPLPASKVPSGQPEVIEGARIILPGHSPALVRFGGQLLLALRQGDSMTEELRFFLANEVGAWSDEPAFTGPPVVDEYDILAVDKTVWVASRDGSGVLKAWVRPEDGEWKAVGITGEHPATQRWRVWLVPGDPVPELLYQRDDGEFVRVTLQ